MIEIRCCSEHLSDIPEASCGAQNPCPHCGRIVQTVSGEQLPEGAGNGDFDAALVAVEGTPSPVGRYLLGGAAEITIGKTAERNIRLPGQQVSRKHCKLVRLDFGPSRWKIVDEGSTNGLYVNGQRVAEHELVDGDTVKIGECNFRYAVASADNLSGAVEAPSFLPAAHDAAASLPYAQAAPPLSRSCPSCGKQLAANAKICVDCGINAVTGRPIITRQGFDENQLYESAHQVIRWVSWIVRFTPMPIPLRSEAFGAKKPYAIWAIAIVTTLVSLGYFLVRYPGHDSLDLNRPAKNLMLWSPWVSNKPITVSELNPAAVQHVVSKMTPHVRDVLKEKYDPLGQMTDDQLAAALIVDVHNNNLGDFQWYQLVTHMYLHDTSSILGFAMHLGGNMLFLLVFGTRVNALIGDLATAILYHVLGVCAATAQLLASGVQGHGPMLGASGAIMGLAGVYLILFPVHQVVCAMWIRLGLLLRARLAYKIFAVRGFWILLIYFGYDLLMNAVNSYLIPKGTSGGVAHWAHIGGFTTGMLVGLAAIFSRQFNARGGDLLSIVFGKHAWPLIGRPSRWVNRRPSFWGSAAFSGGSICLLILAVSIIGLYDPRAMAERLAPGAPPDDANAAAQSPSGGENTSPPAPAAPRQSLANYSGGEGQTALPDGTAKTEMIGGMGGGPYVRVDPAKRTVIGFAIKLGQWAGHVTIGHCDPIYEPPGFARAGGAVCIARDGYVVSGIIVNKKEGADGLQIVFARNTDSGIDTNDTYTSDWFGDTDGSNRTQLAGHGERIIGTFGRQGMNNDAIGLVIDSGSNGAR